MNKLTLLAAAALAASSVAASAQTTIQTGVSTAGLDLATVKGVHAVDLRILHAATALCDTASVADLQGAIKARQCRDQAMANVANERARIIANAQQAAVQTANR